jgi:DNA-binding NarL/FixJ family response regulator
MSKTFRPSKADSPPTEREVEVLWLMAEGLSNKLIAARLEVTEHTAKFHVRNCCLKMDTTNRTQAAVRFILQRTTDAQTKLGRAPQLSLQLVA